MGGGGGGGGGVCGGWGGASGEGILIGFPTLGQCIIFRVRDIVLLLQ